MKHERWLKYVDKLENEELRSSQSVVKLYIRIFGRVVVAFILVYICFSDIYYSYNDPLTYERVYTGEFLGINKSGSLLQFRMECLIQGAIFAIYALCSMLSISIWKQKKQISILLIIIDIYTILYIGFSLISIYR